MKKICLLLFTCLLAFIASAQIKTTAPSVKPTIERVLTSYTYQFSDIKGERLGSDPGTIQFSSTLQSPGSVENKVIGYTGKRTTYWVWESKLLATEDFEELKRKYKAVYNDISGGILKTTTRRFVATGPYESPSEEQRLWSNQFRINENQAPHSNIVIDLVAENIGFEWVIWLRVYDKERDADMRPTQQIIEDDQD